MVSDIRKNLDKVTGELLESFVSFDKDKVLHFQAGLHALYDAQKKRNESEKINLYTICDTSSLEGLLKDYGISKEDFEKVPSAIKECNSSGLKASVNILPELLQRAVDKVNSKARSFLYEVPAAGMIAVSLNLVSSEVKNALIASQAGERILQATERTSVINPSMLAAHKDSILKDRIYDYGSDVRLARPYIGGFGDDPKYLIAAKAMHHLADILEGGVRLYPKMIEYSYVQEAINRFRFLSAGIFSYSSGMLKQAGETDAAEKIDVLVQHITQKGNGRKFVEIFDFYGAMETVEVGLRRSSNDLKNNNILSSKEVSDLNELIGIRREQINQSEELFASA